MRILGIETSCDETAICVLEAEGNLSRPSFSVLGNAVYSQVATHEKYGGVFPMMAKREHAANLVPMLLQALDEARMSEKNEVSQAPDAGEIQKILEREPGLFSAVEEHVFPLKKPDISAIAVTHGPGLEPALWVGVNFAKALSALWNIPVIPANHMEGHVVSVLLDSSEESEGKSGKSGVKFPAIALLISGGHTQLVLAHDWADYEIIGDTRDDAVGEAFDKVARMLGLPYPGGPQISKLAADDRAAHPASAVRLPRPMINSDDLDFSFSGLKTAVLYMVRKLPELTPEIRKNIAREFEDAATDVLVSKTRKAVEAFGARTLIVGGGVSANRHIRASLSKMAGEFSELDIRLPVPHLSTDNAIMIAIAGYVQAKKGSPSRGEFSAVGNLKLKRDK